MVAEADIRNDPRARRRMCPGRFADRFARVTATVLLALLSLCGPVVQAADFKPFLVATPVADQGASSRRAAEREALARVFVRVAGREDVLARAEIRTALRAPQRFYTVSGYERRELSERVADPEGRPWLLVLEFDQRSVVQLLGRLDIPVWTGRRPEILVWIMRETEQGGRELVGSDDPVGMALLARADRRGLDVFLPVLDLTDMAAVSIADAWVGFGSDIARASSRYGGEGLITVRLYPDPLGRWLADWSGTVSGDAVSGAREVTDAALGVQALVDALADQLADRFAIAVGESAGEPLWLQVDDVADVAAYAELMRYLERTNGVVDVQLVQMQGTSMLLRVDAADMGARLLDLLRLETRLEPEATPARAGGVAVWRARWRG